MFVIYIFCFGSILFRVQKRPRRGYMLRDLVHGIGVSNCGAGFVNSKSREQAVKKGWLELSVVG